MAARLSMIQDVDRASNRYLIGCPFCLGRGVRGQFGALVDCEYCLGRGAFASDRDKLELTAREWLLYVHGEIP